LRLLLAQRAVLSIPTRRSSDLLRPDRPHHRRRAAVEVRAVPPTPPRSGGRRVSTAATDDGLSMRHGLDSVVGMGSTMIGSGLYEDRKSTRLNSSHVKRSYAVFC